MKVFLVFSAILAVALAKPGNGVLAARLAYANVIPGASVGLDGHVVETPEVALAKAAHTASHYSAKAALANEAVRSANIGAYATPAVVSAYAAPGAFPLYGPHLAYSAYAPGAPITAYGRVFETPEVAAAKAAHTAAHYDAKATLYDAKATHYKEKANLINEAARNYATYTTPAVVSAYTGSVLTGAYPYTKFVY